jgi:zinc protease
VKKGVRTFVVVAFALSHPAILEARLTPERSVQENGVVLLTSEQRALPMVTLNLLIQAGSRYDSEGREGVANLTSRLLTYGTRDKTALQISEVLDFIGASLATSCGQDVATVSLTVLKKDLDTGLDLLAEILTASVFSPEEIERQKQSVIASIRARDEDPGQVAQVKFAEALFPRSPYGRQVEGTEDSIKKADRAGMLEFYERFYRPERTILAVVGDVSHQEIAQKLTRAFQPWKKGAAIKDSPPVSSPGPANLIRINKNITQANITMGHAGVLRSDPDYYAIQVMNYILGGGGFSSRLMDSVRNERGLAYSVDSHFSAEKYVGSFAVTMQTKNETAQEAIRIAREEIQRIRQEKIKDQELQDAKNYLIGSFPLRLDTNRAVANFLSLVEFYGLGLDYPEKYPELIRRVSQEDVLRVAKKHLQPEKLIVVVVADQKRAKIQK